MSGPPIPREAGEGGQLPGGRHVFSLRRPAGPGVGRQAAVSARTLDVGDRPVQCGGSAGGETGLSVEDGVGARHAGAGLGAPRSASGMDCRGTHLRDATAISGRLGGSGDAVCHGCSTSPAVWPLEPAWTNRPTRCSASTISAGRRRLFLPVHPLFLTALLGHSGAVAGDVEFQDDRVVDHPVDGRLSRASTKHTSGAEQKCTTREVIGQRKCPRQLFGRGVTEAGWQQAGRVSE